MNLAVVALDVGVLMGLAGLYVFEPDVPFSAHAISVPFTYSGPIHLRNLVGAPFDDLIQHTHARSAGSEKSTSMASSSLLKPSSTFSVWIDRLGLIGPVW